MTTKSTFLPRLQELVCNENVADSHVKQVALGALDRRDVENKRGYAPVVDTVVVKHRSPALGAEGVVNSRFGTGSIDEVGWKPRMSRRKNLNRIRLGMDDDGMVSTNGETGNVEAGCCY